jgi:Response regulator containing a CheY-like receiver domain and an HTH DNA-binding domain
MFNLIVIIEESKIIREGICHLLRTNQLCNKIIDLGSFNECPSILNASCPDLVLISPELIREHPHKMKMRYHLEERTRFIGIVYNYQPKEMLESFDEIMYITEPEEIILSKFKKLLSRKARVNGSTSENLTEREKGVLKLLITGLSNKEVADRLIISPHTVITHRKNIVEKTGIRSLAGLAVYAILHNVAEPEEIIGI